MSQRYGPNGADLGGPFDKKNEAWLYKEITRFKGHPNIPVIHKTVPDKISLSRKTRRWNIYLESNCKTRPFPIKTRVIWVLGANVICRKDGFCWTDQWSMLFRRTLGHTSPSPWNKKILGIHKQLKFRVKLKPKLNSKINCTKQKKANKTWNIWTKMWGIHPGETPLVFHPTRLWTTTDAWRGISVTNHCAQCLPRPRPTTNDQREAPKTPGFPEFSTMISQASHTSKAMFQVKHLIFWGVYVYIFIYTHIYINIPWNALPGCISLVLTWRQKRKTGWAQHVFFKDSIDSMIRNIKNPGCNWGTLGNITLPPIIMEVENSPFGDKPHIFQDPIFHETMIMGGRVGNIREPPPLGRPPQQPYKIWLNDRVWERSFGIASCFSTIYQGLEPECQPCL